MPVPRQELVEPVGGMRGDADEDIGEPGLRVDVIEPRGLDRIMHRGHDFGLAIVV